jgi:biotin transport system substrate-specific component
MTTLLLTGNRKMDALPIETYASSFIQVIGASLFLALCSQIKLDLPFTLIPLTMQTFAVMLIGITLGSRKSALAILWYFAEILIGLPVLAGGISNPLIFFAPKAGYYLGFCVQAYSMGWFVEKLKARKSIAIWIGGILGSAMQLGLGVTVLAQFVGWNSVWALGLFPFIPGEILKILTLCFFCLPKKIDDRKGF